MQFTRASDYAARVLSYLVNANGSVSQARSIAVATAIPETFLAKILGQLSRAGLVRAYRGARGGFSLAADPDSLTLLDVVEAVEGPLRLNLCDTPAPCAYAANCPIERAWRQAETSLRDSLRSHKITALAAQSRGAGLFMRALAPERRVP